MLTTTKNMRPFVGWLFTPVPAMAFDWARVWNEIRNEPTLHRSYSNKINIHDSCSQFVTQHTQYSYSTAFGSLNFRWFYLWARKGNSFGILPTLFLFFCCSLNSIYIELGFDLNWIQKYKVFTHTHYILHTCTGFLHLICMPYQIHVNFLFVSSFEKNRGTKLFY